MIRPLSAREIATLRRLIARAPLNPGLASRVGDALDVHAANRVGSLRAALTDALADGAWHPIPVLAVALDVTEREIHITAMRTGAVQHRTNGDRVPIIRLRPDVVDGAV